jgi:peptide/nickel transport system substrate-binding protein
MRPGVLFHDGTPVTAADAAFTLDTAREKKYSGFSSIEKVDSDGDTVTVTLKNPDPEFLPYLTIGIVPRNNADREKNPVGTGPFKIESYAPQQNLVLVKNGAYWREGMPELDKVTVVFLSDSSSLQIGLQGGNIDAANVTSSVIEQLDASKYAIVEGNSNMVQGFFLNNAEPPLDDIRVRQAVNYAIDLDGVIESAFYGHGKVSASPLIPGLVKAYEPSLKDDPYPLDIGKAKALLAEAGYPDGFTLKIAVPSNYSMHVDTAQVIVNQLAKAGVKAEIELKEWQTWLTDVYRGRKAQSTIISFDGSYVPLSPRSFLGRYVTSAGGNLINYKSASYDETYAAALAELDDDKRNALYREAQLIVSRDAASVFIQDIASYAVFPKGYTGILTYPANVADFASLKVNRK